MAATEGIMPNPLRLWRHSKGMRAVDVARAIGVSERSILAYETGAFKPSEKMMKAIAALVSTDEETAKGVWSLWEQQNRHV